MHLTKVLRNAVRANMAEIRRKIILTDKAPAPRPVYSQAVQVNNTLYMSGQLGVDPATGEMVKGGIEAECRQVLKNMGAVLNAAGCTFDNVVKCTVLLSDIKNFMPMNNVYKEFFTSHCPARAAYQVAALPKPKMVAALVFKPVAVPEALKINANVETGLEPWKYRSSNVESYLQQHLKNLALQNVETGLEPWKYRSSNVESYLQQHLKNLALQNVETGLEPWKYRSSNVESYQEHLKNVAL